MEVVRNKDNQLITEYEGVEYKLIPTSSKIPSFIEENEDETFTIKTRKRSYVMKELSGEDLEKARALAPKIGKSEEAVIALKSLVDSDMNESDFFKLGGATYVKLTGAVQYIYELNDFLQ